MPMIEVNGTSLYVEDTGPGSTGKTIVWSHGLLWNTTLFAAQIAALRDRYRCIAWVAARAITASASASCSSPR
jgi:pimeloyl-ACP methyl ester carboxylesterase